MLAGAFDVSSHTGRSRFGLRERLREATASAHRELNSQLSAFHLADLPGYRRFLRASACALLPLEAALLAAGVTETFPDWPERSRSAAIADDLERLGLAEPAGVPVPPLTRSGVFGTMYVLEGSRLGAKVLLKTIADAADPRMAEATAYLGHGAGRGFWQSFLARLASEDDCDEDEAIRSARGAFAAFKQAVAGA